MELLRKGGKFNIRWQLMLYDALIYFAVVGFVVSLYGWEGASLRESVIVIAASLLCLLCSRTAGHVYQMIIRYGGVHVYMRLFATDFVALLLYFPVKWCFPALHLTSQRWLIIIMLNLLGAVGMRLMYRYCYRFGVRRSKQGAWAQCWPTNC